MAQGLSGRGIHGSPRRLPKRGNKHYRGFFQPGRRPKAYSRLPAPPPGSGLGEPWNPRNYKPLIRKGRPFGKKALGFIPKHWPSRVPWGPALKVLGKGLLYAEGYGFAFDLGMALIPFVYPNPDPINGPWAMPGPGAWRSCPTTHNWDDAYIAPFLVDAGEVLGAPLTCLDGQAQFSSNFTDDPANHRNLWQMRFYWIVNPGLGRTASVWVKHQDASVPGPYPKPEPVPLAWPGPAFPPPPANPWEPITRRPMIRWPEWPLTLPWPDAVGSAPRPLGSGGTYGPDDPHLGRRPRGSQLPRGPAQPSPTVSNKPGQKPEHVRKPPGRRVREAKPPGSKKLVSRIVRWIARKAQNLWGAYTEFKDAADILYAALPSSIQSKYSRKLRADQKLAIVGRYFDEINFAKAVHGLATNAVTDWAIGKYGQAAKYGVSRAANHGYWKRPVGSQFGGFRSRYDQQVAARLAQKGISAKRRQQLAKYLRLRRLHYGIQASKDAAGIRPSYFGLWS